MSGNINTNRPLSHYEMGTDDVNVFCTYGKINVWFGRKTPEAVIGKLLLEISNMDKSALHETEMICDFETITAYESHGYVLISYAKAREGYRVIFNVPFHNKKALLHLARAVLNKLTTDDTSLDIYWDGNDSRITQLSDELSNIPGWKVKNVVYKE